MWLVPPAGLILSASGECGIAASVLTKRETASHGLSRSSAGPTNKRDGGKKNITLKIDGGMTGEGKVS